MQSIKVHITKFLYHQRWNLLIPLFFLVTKYIFVATGSLGFLEKFLDDSKGTVNAFPPFNLLFSAGIHTDFLIIVISTGILFFAFAVARLFSLSSSVVGTYWEFYEKEVGGVVQHFFSEMRVSNGTEGLEIYGASFFLVNGKKRKIYSEWTGKVVKVVDEKISTGMSKRMTYAYEVKIRPLDGSEKNECTGLGVANIFRIEGKKGGCGFFTSSNEICKPIQYWMLRCPFYVRILYEGEKGFDRWKNKERNQKLLELFREEQKHTFGKG